MADQVILLVEDNPDEAELALCALRKNGIPHPVIIARSGAEALNVLFGDESNLLTLQLCPHLILMDLKLPKMNGLELLQKIRSHQQAQFIPVIILTTSAEESDLRESYRLHANSYVRKPIDFTKFIQVIGQLVHYWLEVNETPPAIIG